MLRLYGPDGFCNVVESYTELFGIVITDGYESSSVNNFDDIESVRCHLKKFIFNNILERVYEHFFWKNADAQQNDEAVPTPLCYEDEDVDAPQPLSRNTFILRVIDKRSEECKLLLERLENSEAYKLVETKKNLEDTQENREFLNTICDMINDEGIIDGNDEIMFCVNLLTRAREQ